MEKEEKEFLAEEFLKDLETKKELVSFNYYYKKRNYHMLSDERPNVFHETAHTMQMVVFKIFEINGSSMVVGGFHKPDELNLEATILDNPAFDYDECSAKRLFDKYTVVDFVGNWNIGILYLNREIEDEFHIGDYFSLIYELHKTI